MFWLRKLCYFSYLLRASWYFDMPCENMQRTRENFPCLCFYQALYTVFVIPVDGNRQTLGFHRQRKGFVGKVRSESRQCRPLSLQGGTHIYFCPTPCLCLGWVRMHGANFSGFRKQKTNKQHGRLCQRLQTTDLELGVDHTYSLWSCKTILVNISEHVVQATAVCVCFLCVHCCGYWCMFLWGMTLWL